MEVEKDTGGGGGGAVDSSSDHQSERKRFYIELKPGETTIVSWKKLINDSDNKTDSSPPPASPNKSIQEEKSRSKHSGFYVNREKKEHKNESSKSANYQPKKRRNDIPEVLEEKDDVHTPTKHTKLGHVGVKAAAKNAPSMGKHSIQSQGLNATGENCHHARLQHQLNPSIAFSTKNPSDPGMTLECASYAKKSNRDASGSMAEERAIDKIVVTTDTNRANDVNVLDDIPNATLQTYGDRSDAWSEPQSRTLLSNINEEQQNINIEHKDNGRNELPDLNLPYTGQALKTAPTQVNDASGGRVKGTMLERAIQELEKMVAESRPPHSDVQDVDHSQEIKRRLPRELKQKLAKVARLAQSSQGKISDDLFNHLMIILGQWVQLRTLKRYLREMVSDGLSAIKEEDDRFRQIKTEEVEMIKLQTPSLEAEGHKKFKGKNFSTPRTDEILHGEASSIAHPQAVPERLITDTSAFILTLPDTDSIISSKPLTDQNLTAPAKRFSLSPTGSCMDLPEQGKFEILEESSVEQIQLSVKQIELGSKLKKLSLKREKDSNESHMRGVEYYHK